MLFDNTSHKAISTTKPLNPPSKNRIIYDTIYDLVYYYLVYTRYSHTHSDKQASNTRFHSARIKSKLIYFLSTSSFFPQMSLLPR